MINTLTLGHYQYHWHRGVNGLDACSLYAIVTLYICSILFVYLLTHAGYHQSMMPLRLVWASSVFLFSGGGFS